ncbi:MAG: prephenate dehydratase [Methanobacterium sp.]|uniref:prephenate dehydratase n=1 Tax=Methanobacterium sp. TaxID=2164 RepID=UPI003D66084E|nr:prephenate dehydratase [Methanobacterium sp.]
MSNLEKRCKIGFLGPPGTYAEEAASKISGDLLAFDSIMEVLDAVSNGIVNIGVVPIENSIEGPVGVTLDLLAHDYNLKIKNEIILPIRHNLLLNEGSSIMDIDLVYSHAQALSQCRKFIENMGAKPVATPSTSQAAEIVKDKKNAAAIGTRRAAELYDLKIAASNVQDYSNNSTRFVVISKHDHVPTSHDKTSAVFSLIEDRPGGLYDVLGEFAKQNINLTKIESRPSKKKLGNYIFFIDFKGHHEDNEVKNILNTIKTKISYVKILGSYPIEGDD